jgi:hypothetical protein
MKAHIAQALRAALEALGPGLEEMDALGLDLLELEAQLVDLLGMDFPCQVIVEWVEACTEQISTP